MKYYLRSISHRSLHEEILGFRLIFNKGFMDLTVWLLVNAEVALTQTQAKHGS